jgi:Snf7
MYENERAKLGGTKITLEQQIYALESAVVNMEVFQVLGQSAATMKNIRGNM